MSEVEGVPQLALPFEPSLPIETERLVLREIRLDDLDAVAKYFAHAEVARYLYWDPRSRDETRAVVERKTGERRLSKDDDVLSLAIVEKNSAGLVGDCILFLKSVKHAQGEIGFILDPTRQGHGYATEAARELLRIAFEEIGLHRVIGRLESRNEKSAAVLTRIGMRQEAHLIENEFVKDEWQSESVFAILQREWLEHR